MNVIVTAPLVVVPDAAGNLRYFYRGAVIDELSERDYDRLIGDGMIVDAAAAVVGPAVEAEGGAAEGGVGEPPESPSGEPVPERPKQAAPKEAWVDYAVLNGMTAADAEAMTKPELIAKLA
ncbi:hypothetical protein [Nocardia cyriacigeorgica]|uniref:hypothetical protein n=1 Tax=Nocardia cyriacigeorgica TaxID=135487 RepID=UPI0013D67142|nr:hypothetical protein [Nocardia cyriacigeorgica]NEW27251.1 hypothetical protein [Nocardia cyriacigeorgica]